MTNNTDPQNPEAGRAPSQSEQSLQSHVDAVEQTAAQHPSNTRRRFFEITFTRTAHYVSVLTVEARTREGAEDIGEHILTDASALTWDRIGNEMDILSVDEVEMGGQGNE